MSATLTTDRERIAIALHNVIRSFRSPASCLELISETTAILTAQGIEADDGEIYNAVCVSIHNGNVALRNATVNSAGKFSITLEPPTLLALDKKTAIPLRQATKAHLVTHRKFMSQMRKGESVI